MRTLAILLLLVSVSAARAQQSTTFYCKFPTSNDSSVNKMLMKLDVMLKNICPNGSVGNAAMGAAGAVQSTDGQGANVDNGCTTVNGKSTCAEYNAGPCNPALGTCAWQLPMNSVPTCVMSDGGLPPNTCNVCINSSDYCFYGQCEAHAGVPQKLFCFPTTTTVGSTTSTSTSTSSSSTSTTTSTVTTTTLFSCSGSATMLYTGQIDDYWTGHVGDSKSTAPGQYISNALAITVCGFDACLGTPPAVTEDGTLFLQVYDATGANRTNADGNLVAGPGTQLGPNSDTVDATTLTAVLAPSAAVACGGANGGQLVHFTWSGTKPPITGPHWVVVRKTGTILDYRIAAKNDPTSYQGTGDGPSVHTFNLWVAGSDKADDTYFKEYN